MTADGIARDYETTSEHETAEEHETGSEHERAEKHEPASEHESADEQETSPDDSGGAAVLRNRPFLLLWLAQAATQIGGNMVLYGLTVVVLETTRSSAAVSGLILTFLVPAVLLSALAGVFVDRFDPRIVLIVTNVLRGIAIAAMAFSRDALGLIYLLNIFVSTTTTFFSPAEAAMIPKLVPRGQLVAANGVFTLTLNAAFALGFALLGPLVTKVAGSPALLIAVAALYFVAAVFCVTLPAGRRQTLDRLSPAQAVRDAEAAVSSTLGELREGLDYIRLNPMIGWSIVYLGATASLIGVLGVLGPRFAQDTLLLDPSDFVVVVLPLGFGVVMGVLVLNNFGYLVDRRRLIESGLIVMGILIAILSVVGWIPRFVANVSAGAPISLSGIVSVLSVVVTIAFLAGIAYAMVAISAQTQLQEELPQDVRGRVYGVLFTLVSVASFVPVIIVGPIADLVGTTPVLLAVAVLLGGTGMASRLTRRAPVRDRRRRPGDLAGRRPSEPPVLTPDSAAGHSADAERQRR
ncbi:MAG TPA: MFS transporter [Candidatus Acidoferrum sp.]|nr:MFS transporter [Candidatus Acidoferrum sp.]